MPSTRSRPSTLRSAALRGAVAAAALGLAAATHVAAQETTGLRGAFPTAGPAPASPLDRAPRREPLAAEPRNPLQPADGVPVPSYRPVSPGAVPDRDETARIDRLLGAGQAEDRTATPRRDRRISIRQDMASGARRQTGEQLEDPAATGSVTRPAGSPLLPPPDDAPLPPNAPAQRVDAEDEQPPAAIRSVAERTGSIESRAAAAEDSPFGPTGLRAGSFTLRPSLEQGVEWSSNAAGTAGGSSDFMSSTTLRIGAASDWSSHSLTLDAFGAWRRSLRGTGFSELSAGADGALSLDLGRDYTASLTGGYAQLPESPSVDQDTVGRPLRRTYKASAGLAKTVGPVGLSAVAAAERNAYDEATLAAGGTISQAMRNNTLYSLTLRGSYEVSPAARPFVEAEYGRRLYDAPVDAAGYARNATRYGARAGLGFDLGEKFNGEVSAGWLGEKPDDPGLPLLSGFTADANVTWSPLRGTQVNLAVNSGIEATSIAGSTGAFVHGAALSLSREFGTRLTGTAQLNGELRNYAGTGERDTSFGGTASLTWWLNRHAGITGRVGYERLNSTIANRGYGATSAYLGLTLQK